MSALLELIRPRSPSGAEQEDVLRLKIPVQYSPLVHVVQAQRHLHEVVQHLLLPEEPPAGLLDDIGEVAAVAELHHDAERVLVSGHKGTAVAADVGMVEATEQVNLLLAGLSLLVGERGGERS